MIRLAEYASLRSAIPPDALLMAVAYEDPSRADARLKPIDIAPRGVGAWMGG